MDNVKEILIGGTWDVRYGYKKYEGKKDWRNIQLRPSKMYSLFFFTHVQFIRLKIFNCINKVN